MNDDRTTMTAEVPASSEAAAAVRDEALAGSGASDKRLALGGREYRIPATSDAWPLEAAEAFEEGKVLAALRALLGAEQWSALKASGATLSDLNALAEQIAEAYGFDSTGE